MLVNVIILADKMFTRNVYALGTIANVKATIFDAESIRSSPKRQAGSVTAPLVWLSTSFRRAY